MAKDLDLITIGRSSVDLYGEQVGGRLEDMRSFQKYIGGSPTNIAAGAARLGLKAALITRVGDEHMGRFIREELVREGVDVSTVKTDPDRLTALVLLGIRDRNTFPLIFYRENCADMGLVEGDIDPGFISRARCVCATGTHLSNPQTSAAVIKALHLAKESRAKTVLDIDYRPNLWGLAGHNEGESRYIDSDEVTKTILSTVGLFDLIVGTEEEFHIAGGTTDTIVALRAVRQQTRAILVCKRGPMGAVAFEGNIPDRLDEGLTGPGFHVDVFNVLGAGDGFMAGLLYGWLSGAEFQTALKYANACGALAVSRHGCTPSYPSLEELQFFLTHGSKSTALRKDRQLEHVHWSTNRQALWPKLNLISLESSLSRPDPFQSAEALETFRRLVVRAVKSLHRENPTYGLVLPREGSRDLIDFANGNDLYICRMPNRIQAHGDVDDPSTAHDIHSLSEWPREQAVLVRSRIDTDQSDLGNMQDHKDLFEFSRKNRLEFVVELILGPRESLHEVPVKHVLDRYYENLVFPDLWIFDSSCAPLINEVAKAISFHDNYCRGFLVKHGKRPGSDASGPHPTGLRGYVIALGELDQVATKWSTGRLNDDPAIDAIRTAIVHLLSPDKIMS